MACAKAVLCLCLLAITNPAAMAQDQGLLAKMANSTYSPIQKVVMLLKEMQKTVEKDAEDDKIAYDKYMCWCETNKNEKTAAIEAAEEQIASLEAFVEEATAKEAELKSDIEALEQSIAEDQEALETATSLRDKEHAEYEAEFADLTETLTALDGAIKVLSKVQLTQKNVIAGQSEAAALIQVRNIIQQKMGRFPQFKSVMQKDLFDVLSSFNDMTSSQQSSEAFLPKRDAMALDQSSKLLPWEKTEEELGMEAKPNDLVGAAAGAKSYNSRSGSIFGILQQMQETFGKDLAKAEKAEAQAQQAFEELAGAKKEEIKAATDQKDAKEAELADLLDKMAKAKEDIEATKEALGADQEFLLNLEKNCKIVDEEYAARAKVRGEEITALAETLEILTSDDARALAEKTISFVQISSNQLTVAAARDHKLQRAMKRIAAIAKKHHNWVLASLAIRVRLDKFTKVKEMMDKMLVELKAQQKAEYEKWEFCKKAIDETEDKIKEEEHEKEELAEKHESLSNDLAALTEDIKNLKIEVAEMEVSLKKAGIDRHDESVLFQSQVADQRAMINILNIAFARLQEFYGPGALPDAKVGAPAPVLIKDRSNDGYRALVQVYAHHQSTQVPGAPAPPPPPKPAGYEKDGTAGGVMTMLTSIIEEAKTEEADLVSTEQKAQEMYGQYVKDTSNSIEADRASIAEKEEQSAAVSGEISETEEAQLANDEELAKAEELLKAHHLDCDYLLKYFDIRQKARAQEMEAIVDAKAILSGANFGEETD